MEQTIIIQGKDLKKWAILNALDTLGAWDIKFGSLKIDFDGAGKISNVVITTNHRVVEV